MRELASHSVARMADLLTVSRSGYYAWKKREQAGPSPAQQRRQQLTTKIINCHEASDQVYGSPRILADLCDDGEQVSRKTVAKLMRSNGIVGSAHEAGHRRQPFPTWPPPRSLTWSNAGSTRAT